MRSLNAVSLLAALAACGPRAGDGAGFSPARVVSQETENGATPMFLVTAAGDRVVAWVSAPGGGADGSLHLAVTPAGAGEALPP